MAKYETVAIVSFIVNREIEAESEEEVEEIFDRATMYFYAEDDTKQIWDEDDYNLQDYEPNGYHILRCEKIEEGEE